MAGVRVGQVTLQEGQNVRTGVTAILPHPGNQFQQKSPAAIYIGNGFGKLTGYSQVEELGTLETPIVLINTLNVEREWGLRNCRIDWVSDSARKHLFGRYRTVAAE